ncbi:MAG: AAA family ATPase [Lachnospiraceae bacterium]|nr:AAA family ATPase [Lachnospiraceae bacterium]
MVLWETQIKYKDKKTKKAGAKHLIVDSEARNPDQDWCQILKDLNKLMGSKRDSEERISVFFCGGEEGCIEALIAQPIKESSIESCFEYIKKVLEDNYAVTSIEFFEYKEISAKRFDYLGNRADDNGYIRRWHADRASLGIDYFSNGQFKVEEYIEEKEYATLSEAKKAGEAIMADTTLNNELERIYSDANEKKYYGNPVHYRITASSSKSAMDIVDIMVPALIANKRLCGKRILKIHSICAGCYDENDLRNLFETAHGNAVVIEMTGIDDGHGNYAPSYQQAIDYIDTIIEKNHLDTLCFFVEIMDNPGFAEKLIAKVCENIHIISIKEGCGDRSTAKAYLKRLGDKDSFTMSDREIEEALKDKKIFSVEEIYNIYGKWFKNGLRTSIYKAYNDYEFDKPMDEDKKSEPYDDLQKMVGLTEIKQVVDEIIDASKIQKIRWQRGLSAQKASLHMIFTGNPGSAKTTVARLIAQILRKEDILESGNFVECGRADLIARYVGWTAKNVRAKFREAKGGILFIDEAYSLVDDSHSFADEAINTIVQEMENHREDVIVIFAGYPDKMEDFLNKNEGLRSRIAFHLDFPDYDPDEMSEILKLMADARGYQIEAAGMRKCYDIFKSVCKEADFGNGRFVRNLLEQAEMAQAHRLASTANGKKISKNALQTLTAADFDVNSSKKAKSKPIPLGFAV